MDMDISEEGRRRLKYFNGKTEILRIRIFIFVKNK